MPSLLGKLFKSSFVWGGFLTARFALQGVWFHPSSRIFGDSSRVRLCKGTKVSGHVVLRTAGTGRIVLGSRVWLAEGVQFETDRLVDVGNETSIQARSFIHGQVAIGRGCLLAPGVFASSGTHVFRQWPALPIRVQEERAAAVADYAERFHRPVVIEDDCWIGINAVICPGVTVGKGAIVGANAVVNHDVTPYGVVGGVPAQPISKRLDWKPPRQIDATGADAIPYFCGFDVRVDGDTVFATCGQVATIALAAGAVDGIAIDVSASQRTSMSIGASRFELSPGLNRLSVSDIEAFSTTRFGIPHILLPIAHSEAGTAPVRLLAASPVCLKVHGEQGVT